VTPNRLPAGAVITVELTGVSASEMAASGTSAYLQQRTSDHGGWKTIYTLTVVKPAIASGVPDFLPGFVKGPSAPIGVHDPVEFHLPPSLRPGEYRIERTYSTGASGHTSQLSATGELWIVG
jgi:hypothetical protein